MCENRLKTDKGKWAGDSPVVEAAFRVVHRVPSRSPGATPAGVAALDRLDMVVPEGQRLAVLGPSGSGKTTLLRLIAGLESPDSGPIRIGGQDMRGVPPHRRDVAMVFQNPALYPHLSVLTTWPSA